MLNWPLFVCHANCCRSVLAKYLYENLGPNARALSAGMECGDMINDKAEAMLRHWGIDAGGHRPRRIDRELCDRAGSIFVMGPEYLQRLLERHGRDLAAKTYLFADPFVAPEAARDLATFHVFDPSFEERPIAELVQEFAWFRRRILEIHRALTNGGKKLVPAERYLDVLERCFPPGES